MGFWDLFRRRPDIGDGAALADFIDAQAAFLVQKGIYEYARARAGVQAKILFTEPVFLEALEKARWQAFPLGLAMVGEAVESVLRPVGDDPRAVLDGLIAVVLSVFDRYPAPPVLPAADWSAQRTDLATRLDAVLLHATRPIKDIPEAYIDAYFALMPIHERLRGSDYPTVRNHLKATLVNIYDIFVKRADVDALVSDLRARIP
jgi:hypothetical protein